MRVTTKRVDNLTQAEVDRLDRLNMGFSYGMLKARFRTVLEYPDDSYVILAREEGKIIGWALMFRKAGNRYYTVYMYVDKNHRRRGVGTRIMRGALKWSLRNRRQIKVCPWDERSDAFYDNWPKTKRVAY